MFGREPALIIGAINAILAVAVGFGLAVSPAQVGLINAAVAAILAVVTRQQVVPTQVANNQIRTAVNMPVGTKVEAVIEAAKEN